MKFSRRALCALFFATCIAHAATPDDEDVATFGDYAPTVDDDLVVYIPKYTVRLGFRGISGVKAGFSGQGVVSSGSSIGAATGVAARLYHDGYVGLDARTVVDPSGNSVPIAPDGYTNTWSIAGASQLIDPSKPNGGSIQLHDYTAELQDSGPRNQSGGLGVGVEVALERDMGKLFKSKIKWGLIGGVSINQFSAIKKDFVAINLKTTTDLYSLDGQTIPGLDDTGYTAPAGTDTILLRNDLLLRTESLDPNSTQLETRWKMRGAYLTFRGGPTVSVPLFSRFSATFSAGPVLVYAGSTYEVIQTFTPTTGSKITQETSDVKDAFLPGYYFDANLQLSITDNSELYVGAVYQSSSSYTQKVTHTDSEGKEEATYESRLSLSNLQGIRAGINFRF